MIVGALKPDSGSIELDGQPLKTDGRRHIGFVPQELAVYEELSANDNLRFFNAIYGKDDRQAVQRALELVGLTDRANEPVKQFSGGMKRRLNIAIGLVHGPEIVVLDEPTVGVDPQSRNAIFETLERIKGEGVSLLYTTHYMNEVERLCDRVAIMDHGSIIAENGLEELRKLVPKLERVSFDLTEESPTVEIEGGVLEGRKLHFDLADLDKDLPAVLKRLESAGLAYTGVHSHHASLEEVFLHLTGRNLRD